ncbi:hypothetical protein PIB30_107247 [Stylosanthes scabra]|uniref:Uncharacterized protein n=1 Tax=Stylosanthes scabra TaxID=79078 RepID=A0ABU6RZR1_9FABA|nr:hypothetical protein [Stylosanthes scabra]
MEEAEGHTFRSYVRGKVVDFSPENLRNVIEVESLNLMIPTLQAKDSTYDFSLLEDKQCLSLVLKNEERKLTDQETKLGSKTEQDSTHMRMRGRAHICVLLIPQPTPK